MYEVFLNTVGRTKKYYYIKGLTNCKLNIQGSINNNGLGKCESQLDKLSNREPKDIV